MYYLCFFALKYLVKYDINIVELCMKAVQFKTHALNQINWQR